MFVDSLISWLLDVRILDKDKLLKRIEDIDSDKDGYITIKELLSVIRGNDDE